MNSPPILSKAYGQSLPRKVWRYTYPLGNAAIPLAKAEAVPTEAQRCRQWMHDCEASGIILLVPAIAYYESVRDLFQRQATAKVAHIRPTSKVFAST